MVQRHVCSSTFYLWQSKISDTPHLRPEERAVSAFTRNDTVDPGQLGRRRYNQDLSVQQTPLMPINVVI